MDSSKKINYELRALEEAEKVPVKDIDAVSVKIITSSVPSGGPRDTYNLVYLVLLLHGIGNLIPWNMFINAEDYFRTYKLNSTLASPDTDKTKLDELRGDFLSYLSIASMLPNTLFSGLNLIVDVSSENLKFRINLSIVSQLIVFSITILLAFMNTFSWPIVFFYITLVSVCILQMFSGIYGNSLFGVSAHLPRSYINAVLIGNNTSGVFTSIINILCIAVSPGPRSAAISYFFTALVMLIICIITFNLLPYSTFYSYYNNRQALQATQVEKTDSDFTIERDTGKKVLIPDKSNDIPEIVKETVEAMLHTQQPEPPTFLEQLKVRWEVLQECWLQCLNLFLLFTVTLALFPSVLANIKSSNDIVSDKYYSPVMVFLVFNLFALLGNVTSNYATWPGKDRIWILIVLRLVFVPFFLLCNFQPGAVARKWPTLIENDTIFIIGNMLFAMTSGYFSSLCMMFVSRDLKGDRASIASMWGSFFLTFGLLVGANSSFLMTWVVS